MPEQERPYAEQGFTMAQSAAAMVLALAPLVRGQALLPNYAQPLLTWKPTPACDPAWAACIRSAWSRLDLRNPQQFSDAEALIFRYVRMHGLGKLYRLGLTAETRLAPAAWHVRQVKQLVLHLGTILGDKLLETLTRAEREHWLPFHCFFLGPARDERALQLSCDSLCVVELEGEQRAYYSALRPTVLLQGRRLPIAFTAHALARIQARCVVAVDSYDSTVDRFSMANHLNYVEPAVVYPAQPAFALWNMCTPGHITDRYVQACLGPQEGTKPYAYRVGYCPTVQAAGFHVAKTLLVSGFLGTPEYTALFRASLDAAVKQRMLAQCEELSADRLARTLDLSLVRWFHQHGIPQVMPEPPDLFVYPYYHAPS